MGYPAVTSSLNSACSSALKAFSDVVDKVPPPFRSNPDKELTFQGALLLFSCSPAPKKTPLNALARSRGALYEFPKLAAVPERRCGVVVDFF